MCVICIAGISGAEVSNRGAYAEGLKTYKEAYDSYVNAVGPNAQPPQVPQSQPLAGRVADLIREALTGKFDK